MARIKINAGFNPRWTHPAFTGAVALLNVPT